jgi:hypothetical protein
MNVKGGCVVHEDDDGIWHYVRLLRRITILFALTTAVPVILWTITAFIRYQAALPKVSTFHNALATASINAPERGTISEPTQQQSMPQLPKLADPQRANETERAALRASPDALPSAPITAQTADTSSALAAISNSATPMVAKGAHERVTISEPTQQQSMPQQPKLADPQGANETERAALQASPDALPSAPSTAQTADTSSALAAISNSATPMVAEGAHGLPPPFAANEGATAETAGAIQPAVATEAASDVPFDSAPLSGPIPLPRPKPHNAGTVRTADTLRSLVPMPRPRPARGGSGAQQETTTNSPYVPPQHR